MKALREAKACLLDADVASVAGMRLKTALTALVEAVEARGHLQSHGLGGVQNRHYNQHRYDAEKLAALEALFALLTGEPAKITDLAAAREARSA